MSGAGSPVPWAVLTVLVALAPYRPHPVHRAPRDPEERPARGTRSRPLLRVVLDRADLGHRVRAPLRSWGALVAVAAFAGAVAGGGRGAVLAATVAVVLPPALVLARGDHTRARVARDLPAALDAVAAALRAGASMTAALEDGARAVPDSPVGEDLAGVVLDTRAGLPLVAALAAWSARRPGREVRLAAAALSLTVEVGGAQARTVDEVAAVLREQRVLEAEVRVQATQARASATVVGLAPVAFAGLLVLIDPARAAATWTTPVGALAAVSGLTLELVGIVWMRRIVAAAGAGR